jgi:hypothetical protein
VFLAVLFPPVPAYQRGKCQKGPIPNIKKRGPCGGKGGERGGSGMYWAALSLIFGNEWLWSRASSYCEMSLSHVKN